MTADSSPRVRREDSDSSDNYRSPGGVDRRGLGQPAPATGGRIIFSYQGITGGSTLHDVWNTVAVLLVIITLLVVLRIPAGSYRAGWSTKAWWVAAAIMGTGSAAGLIVPLGVVVLPFAVAKARRCPTASDRRHLRPTALDWLWWVVIGGGLIGGLVLLLAPGRPQRAWPLTVALVDEVINAGFTAWLIVGGIRILVRRRRQRPLDSPPGMLVPDPLQASSGILPPGYINGPSHTQ